jgi:hypothetical protein
MRIVRERERAAGGATAGPSRRRATRPELSLDDPNIATDLATFDATYHLSAPPSFTIDNLGAKTTDAGWSLETSLDVEWAHAIATAANIILGARESPAGASSQIFLFHSPSPSSQETNPMTRPAVVSYEPTLVQTPLASGPAVPFFANDEFDIALREVATSSKMRPRQRTRMFGSIGGNTPEADSGISRVATAGIVAADGYRLVLRSPDDPKSRPSWYSRFPSIGSK